MVLLSQTKFPVESGLQSIFQSSDTSDSTTALIFLVVSILWSFKTAAITSVKIKSETKNILPLVPTVILGTRYLLVFLIRIGAIVTYYAPFLGLCGIMDHHQGEKIPLQYETYKALLKTGYHHYNPIRNQFQVTDISTVFRSEYTGRDLFLHLKQTWLSFKIFFLKPSHFKKQRSSSSFLLT